jgi:2-polyprenyl-3-methyl-5-hydroxy-6-metoxy-1,4-benzoquinol methylase
VGTDSVLESTPRGQSRLLWTALRDAVAQRPADDPVRVLDCGGGSGSLAVPLAGLGAQVTVVDVSIDALGTLLRRASEAGVSEQVAAVQGEAESLTSLFDAGAFDLVLAHEVLDNVGNVPATLREIVAVLRPGGTVSVVVVNPVASVIGRALAGDVAGALAAVRRPPAELADLADLAALREQCEAAGLEVDSVYGLGVFTEMVPGIDLERPGAMSALADLEAETSGRAPYRDIATRLHVMARRPAAD